MELYRLPRQRMLSLRFLSSYVLGVQIQGECHDSLEDARAALALYTAYCRLRERGAVAEKLAEIYMWGKRFGWEPVTWRDGQPEPPTMRAPVA